MSTLKAAHRGLRTRAQTFFSPTPEYVRSRLRSPPSSESTSVFLLSTSLQELPELLPILQQHTPNNIGSFSVTAPGTEATLSVATFSKDDVHIFRSKSSGRPPAEVGRFQRPETQRIQREEDMKGTGQGEAEATLAGEGWAGMWKGELSVERIPELEGVDAQHFLLLTDGRPGPVLRALDEMYPSASKLGILTAATPFVTNRPYTLLHNGSIYSSGTLGLAVRHRPSTTLDFGLLPMTEPVKISGAQGNMLLSIEGSNTNPTQMLIGAIQRRGGTGITKEEDFYLGMLNEGDTRRVVKILSGDPSRGALSVDMEDPLLVGQTIQFLHRHGQSPIPQPAPNTFTFSSLLRSDDTGNVKSGSPRVVDGFMGFSEEGIIYSNPMSSICTAPGAVISATW
ncbi:uncharacterized protein IL334_005419 [Kwoniella shivajii]|uniref:FIST domain-containing protein n=1 Tax=Kwoniella shivajii TaxID=564305 RepID=A0ABZ1D3S1_9TREE|nr:hypothetical protein IL334_005419 [Kwoniella shivajii]